MIYIKPSNGATMDISVEEFKKLPEKQMNRWRKATESEQQDHTDRLKKQEIAKAQRKERNAKIGKRNDDKKTATKVNDGNGKPSDTKAESKGPKK